MSHYLFPLPIIEFLSLIVSSTLIENSLYRQLTNLTRFPLWISAVFKVCKQNKIRLNSVSVAAQIAPPLLSGG